jgi:uncharacterized membrane protein YhhN
MIAATITCAIACAVLIAAEIRRAGALRAISKTTASLAFLAAGVLAWHGEPSRFALLIVAGQASGVVGDVALLGRGGAAFLAGLGAFLVGHVAYVIAIAQLLPPAPGAACALAAIPIAGGAIALRWLWPHVEGKLRGPVLAYVGTIVAMVAVALIAATHGALPATARARLAAAALAFFVSDLAVARDRFVAPTVINRVWGLPAYYAAQLLFAWTIAS